MPAFEPKFTINNSITKSLTLIERARGFLDAANLSDQWVNQMQSRALLLEAHHTTHIEGTALTLDQAEKIWNGEEVEDANQDDRVELLNYRHAFEFVSQYMSSDGPVTEGLIRELHSRLVEGVRGGQGMPGEFRAVQNYVVNAATGAVVYEPPPAGDVPDLMHQLVEWLNTDDETHPVLVSGIAQFQLVHIHPFVDGNGRTSRLLSTLLLYRAGYDFKRLFSLSEFYDRVRPKFYDAIQNVRNCGMDITGWLEFFVDGLATQMAEVQAKGTEAIRLDVLAFEKNLNERQLAGLRFILKHRSLDIAQFEKLNSAVSRRTLQRDLSNLEEKQIICSTGSTNNKVYALADKILVNLAK